MNKHLYEAVYYKLQTERSTLIGTLHNLMVEENTCTPEIVENAQCLLMRIVQIDAAVHELGKRYKLRHEAPLPADARREKETERWEELNRRLARIDEHTNPSVPAPRSEGLSHEELLERSSAYRNSQPGAPSVVIAEIVEEE